MCGRGLRGARVARVAAAAAWRNDVAKLGTPGKALYSWHAERAVAGHRDTIVYYCPTSWFRAVVNAGTRDKDLALIRRHAQPAAVEVTERTDLAMLADPGPEGRAKAVQLLRAADAGTGARAATFVGREVGGWFVARPATPRGTGSRS